MNFHNSTTGNSVSTPSGHNTQQHLQQQHHQPSHLDSGANAAADNTITTESPLASTTTCTSPGQLQQHHTNNNGSPGNGVGGASVTALHSILGSTPLSQIGSAPLNLDQYSGMSLLLNICGFVDVGWCSCWGLDLNTGNLSLIAGQLSPCGSSDELDSDGDSNNDDIGSNFSNSNSSKRQKRGILPKHATSVMRAWLFQHLVVSAGFIFGLVIFFLYLLF